MICTSARSCCFAGLIAKQGLHSQGREQGHARGSSPVCYVMHERMNVPHATAPVKFWGSVLLRAASAGKPGLVLGLHANQNSTPGPQARLCRVGSRRQGSLRRYHTRSGGGGTCLPRSLLVPGSDAAAEPLGPSLQSFATTPSMMASSVVWFSCSLSLSAMLTRKKTDRVWPLGRAQKAKTHIWQGAHAPFHSAAHAQSPPDLHCLCFPAQARRFFVN